MGAIPETEIAAWFENAEIAMEDRERFHSFLTLMDAEFRAYVQERAATKRPKK